MEAIVNKSRAGNCEICASKAEYIFFPPQFVKIVTGLAEMFFIWLRTLKNIKVKVKEVIKAIEILLQNRK